MNEGIGHAAAQPSRARGPTTGRLRHQAACALFLALAACMGEAGDLPPGTTAAAGGAGGGDDVLDGGGGPGVLPATLDKATAEARFATTTELMRYVVSPGCAAERNECHHTEDFPDLSTEGNLWNLVGQPCNQGLGDRKTVEDFCEALGDELRIDSGASAGFTARIGSITQVATASGAFSYYEVRLDQAPAASQTGGAFSIVRGGQKLQALGGGASAELQAGQKWVRVRNANHLPSPAAVLQGDENQNGVFGAGAGLMVKPGDAPGSYVVRRLLGKETARVRMPLGANADQQTEVNRVLTPNEAYALMSWINCMLPGDGPYSAIRYGCAANAANEGR
ncbi:MAG: hypothetical protein IPJ65_14475 [Archangiaceae bacterium]|nr:hypothetical protein [Archangiaceae bacterium]